MIDAILKRHPHAKRDSLIPILQEVQHEQGYISKEAVIQIGEHLNLPASKIYGVTTFYNQFRFHMRGKYHLMVCRGTACHVKGSAGVVPAIKKILKIDPGQTTRDGLFSLEVVGCMGACGQAPVMSVNEEYFGGVTAEKVEEIVHFYRSKEGTECG